MSPLRFVREGRWKYIHKVNPELYDVIADPGELDNKFEAEPVVAKGLRAKLAAMLETAPVSNSASRIDITPQAEAQLRALGYVEVAGATTLSSGGESLELFGEDPSSRTEDIDRAGWAVGAIVAKKYDDALEWARPLFARNPTSVLAGDLLSEALVQLERWPEATVVLSEILEHRPEAFVVREKLVTVLEGQGRLEEAVEELVRLNQDRPCHEPTLGMLNTSLYQQRQFEAQLSILETGARDCPNLLPVVNNYAWALATLPEAKLRDGAKAIKLIRNVIAKPGQRSPAFLDTLAAGLAEEGKFDEAIEMQTEVIKMLREAGAAEDVMRQFIQHLDTYRSSLPLRDPPV